MKIVEYVRAHKKPFLWIAAIVVVLLILVITKPSMETLRTSMSQELRDLEGNHVSSEVNLGIAGAVRGKVQRTAESETYIGVLGMVIQADEGIAKTAGDVLLWLPQLFRGAVTTVELSVVAMLAGIVLGVFLALGKISKNKVVSKLCSAYIFFFRGTPLLMQLFFIYYGLPTISMSLAINNKFFAAFVAFALNFGAYCAELVRAAIQSIDKGQFEASKALGMTGTQNMRLVILPQTIRRLIPPMSNEFIMALKDVSLVSLIALSDLTHVTRSISSSTASVTVFIPAMIIYLIITAIFTFIFNRIEKRFSIYD